MPRILGILVSLLFLIVTQTASAHSSYGSCSKLLETSKTRAYVDWLKKKAVDKTLDLMGALKGLPRYLKLVEELERTGRYRKYGDFGEMGLAELGISVRYNRTNLDTLNTGRPLIIVANHHLGIADGLTLQYLAGQSRKGSPTLLFLARWIEKLMPFAVFGDEHQWGTAVPVEINLPKESDPEYESKLAAVKTFNKSWSRSSLRVLKNGGALIIFPAGHVASINEGAGSYPQNVFDAPDSWQEGFLNLARLGKADIVFANVASVNSEAFYRNRKRFGGGDKERVIWFFSEAIAKKDQFIDVYLSKPMSLEVIYEILSRRYGHSREHLEADPRLSAELMRRMTYDIAGWAPQELDAQDSPRGFSANLR